MPCKPVGVRSIYAPHADYTLTTHVADCSLPGLIGASSVCEATKKINLVPNAREKRNLGGLDSSGSEALFPPQLTPMSLHSACVLWTELQQSDTHASLYKSVVTVMVTRTTQSPFRHVIV